MHPSLSSPARTAAWRGGSLPPPTVVPGRPRSPPRSSRRNSRRSARPLDVNRSDVDPRGWPWDKGGWATGRSNRSDLRNAASTVDKGRASMTDSLRGPLGRDLRRQRHRRVPDGAGAVLPNLCARRGRPRRFATSSPARWAPPPRASAAATSTAPHKAAAINLGRKPRRRPEAARGWRWGLSSPRLGADRHGRRGGRDSRRGLSVSRAGRAPRTR